MSKNTLIGLILVVVGVLLMIFVGVVGLVIGVILTLGGIAFLWLGWMAKRSAPS